MFCDVSHFRTSLRFKRSLGRVIIFQQNATRAAGQVGTPFRLSLRTLYVQMLSVYVRSYILVERLFWHMRSQSELILLIVADLYIYVSENKQNKLAYATPG